MSVVDPATPALRLLGRRRAVTLAGLAALILYLAYAFAAFDVIGAAGRARMDNALLLMQDFWSHKTHVTRDNRSGAVTTAIEGSRKMTYPAGREPAWVHSQAGGVTVDLPRATVAIDAAGTITLTGPEGGPFTITPARAGIRIAAPGALPDWISASDSRVAMTVPGGGRISVTKARTEVMRRFPGWECFFFTLDSRWSGMGPLALLHAAVTQRQWLSLNSFNNKHFQMKRAL